METTEASVLSDLIPAVAPYAWHLFGAVSTVAVGLIARVLIRFIEARTGWDLSERTEATIHEVVRCVVRAVEEGTRKKGESYLGDLSGEGKLDEAIGRINNRLAKDNIVIPRDEAVDRVHAELDTLRSEAASGGGSLGE